MKDLHTLDHYRLREDERVLYGCEGDGGNGVFKVFVSGRSFRVIASNGGGWDHVSVSRPNRCPMWEEMCAIKDMFFYPEERVVQYHPPHSEYVNLHPYCLHLWKPNDGAELPYPPQNYVG